MQKFLALAALVIVSACVEKKPEPPKKSLAENLVSDCYTVDLFDPFQIEYPDGSVPADSRAFLGVWKQGAWNGNWCHDLYVTKVHADGRVEVLDAHAPDLKGGNDATVFKRTGRIEDGVLTLVSLGSAQVKYRVEGDFLLGERIDAFGKSEIVLGREVGLAQVPIPPIKPVQRS